MEKYNRMNSNGRSMPVYRLFKDAVSAAKAAAKETGETRYVHHGLVGLVVLAYPTPGTVKVERPAKVRVRRAGS